MSFDAWVLAFGLSRLLQELRIVESSAAYLVLVAVGVLDLWLLYGFFTGPAKAGHYVRSVRLQADKPSD